MNTVTEDEVANLVVRFYQGTPFEKLTIEEQSAFERYCVEKGRISDSSTTA